MNRAGLCESIRVLAESIRKPFGDESTPSPALYFLALHLKNEDNLFYIRHVKKNSQKTKTKLGYQQGAVCR